MVYAIQDATLHHASTEYWWAEQSIILPLAELALVDRPPLPLALALVVGHLADSVQDNHDYERDK